MIQYVGGFLFHKRQMGPLQQKIQVALVTKNKPDWQRGLLNCVGGKIETERGETPLQAMVREFEEETKLMTMEFDWFPKITLTAADRTWQVFFFAAFWNSQAKLTGLKGKPVSWYPIEPLPSHVIPNLRTFIPLCLDRDLVMPVNFIDKRGMDYGKRTEEIKTNKDSKGIKEVSNKEHTS